MKTITATMLRRNIFKLLDEVLITGTPLEIKKGNQKLKIIALNEHDKLQNLTSRPHTINGHPDELIDICWEKEINLDLP